MLEDAGIERGEVFIANAVKRFKFTSRGKRQLHQAPNGDGRKVLPTIHPSYLFRFRGDMERERERTRLMHDLVSVRMESERSG